MNIGDLVHMPGSSENHAVGIVIELPFVGDKGQRQQTPRVGIMWADGEGIDWEPKAWLEVISESR